MIEQYLPNNNEKELQRRFTNFFECIPAPGGRGTETLAGWRRTSMFAGLGHRPTVTLHEIFIFSFLLSTKGSVCPDSGQRKRSVQLRCRVLY
jgi:hypothetical protein